MKFHEICHHDRFQMTTFHSALIVFKANNTTQNITGLDKGRQKFKRIFLRPIPDIHFKIFKAISFKNS